MSSEFRASINPTFRCLTSAEGASQSCIGRMQWRWRGNGSVVAVRRRTSCTKRASRAAQTSRSAMTKCESRSSTPCSSIHRLQRCIEAGAPQGGSGEPFRQGLEGHDVGLAQAPAQALADLRAHGWRALRRLRTGTTRQLPPAPPPAAGRARPCASMAGERSALRPASPPRTSCVVGPRKSDRPVPLILHGGVLEQPASSPTPLSPTLNRNVHTSGSKALRWCSHDKCCFPSRKPHCAPITQDL